MLRTRAVHGETVSDTIAASSIASRMGLVAASTPGRCEPPPTLLEKDPKRVSEILACRVDVRSSHRRFCSKTEMARSDHGFSPRESVSPRCWCLHFHDRPPGPSSSTRSLRCPSESRLSGWPCLAFVISTESVPADLGFAPSMHSSPSARRTEGATSRLVADDGLIAFFAKATEKISSRAARAIALRRADAGAGPGMTRVDCVPPSIRPGCFQVSANAAIRCP